MVVGSISLWGKPLLGQTCAPQNDERPTWQSINYEYALPSPIFQNSKAMSMYLLRSTPVSDWELHSVRNTSEVETVPRKTTTVQVLLCFIFLVGYSTNVTTANMHFLHPTPRGLYEQSAEKAWLLKIMVYQTSNQTRIQAKLPGTLVW